MRISSWEASRKRISSYRQRDPTENVLYRVIYEHREAFEYLWEELFQSKHGALRAEVLESFDKYLNCGILFNGCAYLECLDCKYSELLAFSCKQRTLCPSCSAKRALLFSENLVDNILEVAPHSHAVFTIPKRLRPYFKFNRDLNKHLYQASWQSIRQWQADSDNSPACAMSLHTSGDLLNWHPHVHALVKNGVIDTQDTDWLTSLFASNLFDLLEYEPCIEPEVIENLKSWTHSGFNVWLGEPVAYEQTEDLKFLARYLRKSAAINPRIELNQDSSTIRVTKLYDDTKTHKDFTPLEFMAELSQHIPNKWEQTTRFYGQYSARTRGTKTTRYDEPNIIPISSLEERKKPTPTWAACMKLVFEIDTLVCPKCSGEMKIRNFIFDSKEISRIAKYSGQVAWKAPPPLKQTKAA